MIICIKLRHIRGPKEETKLLQGSMGHPKDESLIVDDYSTFSYQYSFVPLSVSYVT